MPMHFKDRVEIRAFIASEVLTSSEAIELLGITRQRLNQMVKTGKLVPIKELPRDRLFLRSDVEERKKELEELRRKYRPYDH